MPTYQYACTECDHAFEQVQSFTDDALTECPQCSGRLRKLFNAVGVVFKGSGFYRTDSRGSSGSGESSGSNGSAASDKASGTSNGSGNGSSNGSSNGSGAEKASSATKTTSKPAASSSD